VRTPGLCSRAVTNASLETEPASTRRARWLLAAGAVAGLALASTGLLEEAPSGAGRADAVAAEVNGTVISMATFERARDALAQDKRNPLSAEDEQYVLDRLIEEELLVQRATALGLDRSNPVVRNTLVSAMIEIVVQGVGQREPTPEEVEAFYDENRAFFARQDRYWVRQLRFPFGGDGANEQTARETAERAAARLRNGDRAAVVARELGGGSVAPLPDGYLPAAKLREYVGPTPAARATRMQPGEVSEPIRAGGAWHVLQMVERISSPPLPLSAVESQVRAEMRRRAGDESLRTYLEQLREDAVVHVPAS